MYRFYKYGEKVKVVLHKYFYYYLPLNDLKKIGVEKVENAELVGNINNSKLRFLLLSRRNGAKNVLNNRNVTIIDYENPLPLIGSLYFGFIDRGTNIIEVRPMTGCNLDCIYCSVGEGLHDRLNDFFVDVNYLLDWAGAIYKEKNSEMLEWLINPQGEPMLYPYLLELIKGLSRFGKVSMITNGSLLTEERVEEMIRAGLKSLHISLNGISKEYLNLYGVAYPIDNVLDSIRHASKKIEVVLTPVWIKGYNDKGIEEVIEFGKDIGANFGIQNYLLYKHGKRIKGYKEVSWKEFYTFLHLLEEKYKVKLLLKKEDVNIVPLKHLAKPFYKGNIVSGIVKSYGRYKNEYIVVSSNRIISVSYDRPILQKRVSVRIKRDKDNIFYGEIVKFLK